MGIGIVRRDAVNIDFRAGIDNLGKVGAQHVPVQGAVFIIDVALVPDAHVVSPLDCYRSDAGTAADEQRLTGDEAAGRAGEEHHCLRDIVRGA